MFTLFVRVFSQFDIGFGALLSCCSTNTHPPINLCVRQKLAPLTSATDEPCTDQFDCPLLTLTYDLCLTTVSCVIKTMCIVHHCTQACSFFDNVTCSRVERKPVASSKSVFLHNSCNRTYRYNIFYTSNNY